MSTAQLIVTSSTCQYFLRSNESGINILKTLFNSKAFACGVTLEGSLFDLQTRNSLGVDPDFHLIEPWILHLKLRS